MTPAQRERARDAAQHAVRCLSEDDGHLDAIAVAALRVALLAATSGPVALEQTEAVAA